MPLTGRSRFGALRFSFAWRSLAEAVVSRDLCRFAAMFSVE
jgi:hypothetical protein